MHPKSKARMRYELAMASLQVTGLKAVLWALKLTGVNTSAIADSIETTERHIADMRYGLNNG